MLTAREHRKRAGPPFAGQDGLNIGATGGLAPGPPRAYLSGAMTFLKYLSPIRAMRDLWRFLGNRPRHELYLMVPALLIVVGILYAFYKDSRFEREYKPNIIYVKSWPLNRSDEEIAAQAKIDNAERDKQRAALAKKQKERQEGFQKLDNSLKEWGF